MYSNVLKHHLYTSHEKSRRMLAKSVAYHAKNIMAITAGILASG
jgi:hypothetical protein